MHQSFTSEPLKKKTNKASSVFFCNGHLISLISQSRRSFSRTNIACFVSTLFAGHTVCSLFWVLDLWTTASSTGPSHLYKRKEQLDWKRVRNERHHGKDKNGTPSHLPSRTNLHAERGVWARGRRSYLRIQSTNIPLFRR